MTQSAVSRQIATLEDYLKVQLFARERSGVSLTKIGESYYREVGPAFAAIASSTGRLLMNGRARPLYVRAYPTFAVKWLVPRIAGFNAEHPGIDVRITTGIEPVDFTNEQLDLSIELMLDSDAGAHHIRLFSYLIQPVCSPALLAEGSRPPLETIDDLREHRLLHSRYRRHDWHDWLRHVGAQSVLDVAGAVEFPSSVLTYQAASEGVGVAIAQIRLLEQDIGAGRLVPLFGPPLERPISYYVAWSPKREPKYKARVFLSWLEKEAASSAAGSASPVRAPESARRQTA